MCRKLTLTGWVLQIRGEAEQARVIVALFVDHHAAERQLCVYAV